MKSTGTWYHVREESTGEIAQCRIVGKFRLDNIPLTNPVAVGDRVDYALEQKEGDQPIGTIKKIHARRNYIVRQSPRSHHDMHLLAANIDQAVLVVTVVEPNLKPAFIDRFLLMTEPHEIPAVIIFNKADVYSEADLAVFEEMKAVYEKIGYRVLLTSAETGLGLAEFEALLKDKTTLISGQSGVGKSSLVNAIQQQLQLRTGEISDYSGKGQHTTTFAEMFPLTFGGNLIDTPGIKLLGFNNKDVLNIAHSFREFFAKSDECRFGGSCTHREEPGCAVRKAIADGEISELRYMNYLSLLAETESQNYWERRKEI